VSEVRALFERQAAGWPAKYAPGGPLAGRLDRLSTAVTTAVPPGGAVLDLGCGSGELARRLAATGRQVTGCDISPAMLAAAASDAGGPVRWLVLEPGWRMLPFADGRFEAVVASSVLEYVPDAAAVLAECGRVLARGGALYATVPDLRHPVRWAEAAGRLAARALPGHGTGRAASYLADLRLSRQRHRAAWWRAAAARAGLDCADLDPAAPVGPLRLLALTRPAGAGR
jgi:SAM-dependent methyltransferase